MKHEDMRLQKLGGCLLLSGLMVLFLLSPIARAAFPGSADNGPASFAGLADQVKHSVVNIATTQVVKVSPLQPFFGPEAPFGEFFRHFFGDMPRGPMKTHALGSGFIISEDGFILTNNHVVEKATEIKVRLESGKEYDARVIGKDPKTDLALIKVKPDADFPKPAHLGDSDATQVGDWVMAVGNPFGLGQTVTTGIISAKGRIIGAGPYDDFLQTDAAINPGNSGGPLFDMKGKVIGINTAIIAQGQNIGFAIPVNMAKDLLPQLRSGKIIRGWLGVMIQDITPELAESFGLKVTKGVLISDVAEGSPAEKAGLKRGDVLTRFDGKQVENAHMLSRLVAATQPNSKVTLDIIREGEVKSIELTTGSMPTKEAGELPEKAAAWGLEVQDITPELAQELGLSPDEQGVIISGVEAGSPAAAARLKAGDVIQEVNRQEVQNVTEYNQALAKARKGEALLLLVKRAGGTFYVVLKPVSGD